MNSSTSLFGRKYFQFKGRLFFFINLLSLIIETPVLMQGWHRLLYTVYRISCTYARSADLDQTSRSAASNLSLQCLPVSFYRTLGLNGLSRLVIYKIVHVYLSTQSRPTLSVYMQ